MIRSLVIKDGEIGEQEQASLLEIRQYESDGDIWDQE